MSSEDYLLMLIAPEDLHMVQEKFRDAFKGKHGDIYETRILRKDGSRFWASISWRTILDEDGQPIGIRTSIQDITHSKKLKENLVESEARLKRAELVSKTGNWEYHIDTKKLIVSEGAARIFGSDSSEMDLDYVRKVQLPEYHPIIEKILNFLCLEITKTFGFGNRNTSLFVFAAFIGVSIDDNAYSIICYDIVFEPFLFIFIQFPTHECGLAFTLQ